MEELFVYSLLYSIGYEKYDEYKEALDNLFCCTPEDEILLDLEGRDYKDAMLHLYQLMNELSFNIIKFGGQLMSELKTVYEESDIVGFSEKMYDLWKLLPDKINNEEPFYTLNYAGDCLSYGDEIRCCELYKCALNYYEDNSNQYKEV